MYISNETTTQIESRLLKVIAQAELLVLKSTYVFEEFPVQGFVGWLASHLKQRLGTGVFVVCGQNSTRGGIFDYWGSPYELGCDFVKEVEYLMDKGKQLL